MPAQARSIGPLFRSAVLATLVALATQPSAGWASSPDPRNAPATSWDVRLGANGDPGDPFEMTGTVGEEEGTIVRGRKVLVYHADDIGQYAERDGAMRDA